MRVKQACRPAAHLAVEEDSSRENQDPAEEIEWGKRMSAMRSKFLKELVDEMEADNKRKRSSNTPAQSSYTSSAYTSQSNMHCGMPLLTSLCNSSRAIELA